LIRPPRANMLLRFATCDDILKYVSEDDVTILGLDENTYSNCFESIAKAGKDVVFLPRRIVEISINSIREVSVAKKSALPAFKPRDTASARSLARIRQSVVILLTPDTLQFVDEYEVNFLKQAHTRKFIEVSLGEFIKNLLGASIRQGAKSMYMLSETIEKALKSDVGVVASGAVELYPKCLFTTHIDVLLYSMGFSKRERRMILEVYPLELLDTWLRGE